jgi:hypothetical protein
MVGEFRRFGAKHLVHNDRGEELTDGNAIARTIPSRPGSFGQVTISDY